MPAHYALGQRPALVEVQESLQLGEPLLSFLDDTNFVVQPERVRPVLDLLAAALWRQSVPPRLSLLSCSACPPATPACSSASVGLRICRLRGCCCCSARPLGATMCFGCSSLASLRLLLLLMTQPCWTVCRTCCSAALCQLSPLVLRSFSCAWGVSACVLLLLQPPPLTGFLGPIVCRVPSLTFFQLLACVAAGPVCWSAVHCPSGLASVVGPSALVPCTPSASEKAFHRSKPSTGSQD